MASDPQLEFNENVTALLTTLTNEVKNQRQELEQLKMKVQDLEDSS